MASKRGFSDEELQQILESEDEYLPSEIEYSSDSETEDIGIEEQENEEVNIATTGTSGNTARNAGPKFQWRFDDNFVPPNMNFDNLNSGVNGNLGFLEDSPELAVLNLLTNLNGMTKMKWLLCIVLVSLVEIQARPMHGKSGPEIVCLEEEHVTMEQVMPFVHKITDPKDTEHVGPYLACVWKKRNVITETGSVSGKYLAEYLLGIYESLNLTEEQQNEVRNESLTCEELVEDKLSTLAIKVKNCMITVRDNLNFLKFPKH
ncbi:hypothetical protein RN001_000269 [Aquatica leii]|uniref:Uncharacterized protein n=1 Tax=Aquatica leii TaxID=1421715 RepID=A0AAN7QLY4_9COLE|nr:hypothetical protein RN001_000269 [Aquatica leii]